MSESAAGPAHLGAEPNPVSVDPFAPDAGLAWVGVSPRLTTARRMVAVPLAVLLALGAVVAVVAAAGPSWGVVPALVGIGAAGWVWWLIGRQVRAMGYAERGDDLLVVSGVMFRRLVIVPYGRMQLVDVTAGPLDRRFGIAKVQLHTAAATTDATIHGLPVERAAALRDQLAALGEQRSAGL
jgi:membrane protein YdbS with pleckstrin-like domain